MASSSFLCLISFCKLRLRRLITKDLRLIVALRNSFWALPIALALFIGSRLKEPWRHGRGDQIAPGQNWALRQCERRWGAILPSEVTITYTLCSATAECRTQSSLLCSLPERYFVCREKFPRVWRASTPCVRWHWSAKESPLQDSRPVYNSVLCPF